MNFSYKDVAATGLVGLAGVVTYAVAADLGWPLLSSWRMGSLALLIIGFASCIVVGSGSVPAKNRWTTSASVLGGIAAVSGILGIIFNQAIFFAILAATIFGLWALTTIHHLTASHTPITVSS